MTKTKTWMTSDIHSPNKRKAKPQTAYVDIYYEAVAAALQRSGMTDEQIADKISAARGSRMAVITVTNVRELIVSRPNSYTLMWLAWSVGKRLPTNILVDIEYDYIPKKRDVEK